MLNTLLILACAISLVSSGDEPIEDDDNLSTISLPADNEGTASIGHPYTGKLRGGVRLPPSGPYHVAQRSTRARNWLFGTGYLVRGIMVAAESVAQLHPRGEPLVVGNLSRREGGDIKLSMSHNSGRDVDFAYYVMDMTGKSVPSEYHRFGADGISLDAPDKFKLDLARNWHLLKSLIQSSQLEVQWIIVAPSIEKLLLSYAATQGESKEFIDQAERMMMLPGYAKAHDNHIHLRVQCSPDDWNNGCKIGGPVWPWNHQLHAVLSNATRVLLPQLAANSPKERRSALRLIRKKQMGGAVTQVASMLSDVELSVRREALLTLVELSNEANASTILEIARRHPAKIATRLITKALPLAGSAGVQTAQELLNGSHPMLSKRNGVLKNKKLRRHAKRTLRKYN